MDEEAVEFRVQWRGFRIGGARGRTAGGRMGKEQDSSKVVEERERVEEGKGKGKGSAV
jgi:hypothetical protein